jgi:hypothetical protein
MAQLSIKVDSRNVAVGLDNFEESTADAVADLRLLIGYARAGDTLTIKSNHSILTLTIDSKVRRED